MNNNRYDMPANPFNKPPATFTELFRRYEAWHIETQLDPSYNESFIQCLRRLYGQQVISVADEAAITPLSVTKQVNALARLWGLTPARE